MKFLTISFCVIFFYQNTNQVNGIQCLNEENQPVDWFVLYKFPKIKKNANQLINKGLSYSYITPTDKEWIISNLSMNDSNSITGLTLNPLYQKKTSLYLLYNDEPPNEPTRNTGGHTKGFILSNSSHGLWMIHSVPHFPPAENFNYQYPTSGLNNGQSFLCISLNLSQINVIGQQLLYNEPYLYSKYIAPKLASFLPNILSLINKGTIKSAPWYNIVDIISIGREKFTSFAKSHKFQKELYVDLVAPTLQTDLLVETWQNEGDKLKSNCTRKFRVRNVQDVSFQKFNIDFTSSKDHSKWAIEDHNSSLHGFACIGDINRDEHQLYRGGGTVCFQNTIIYKNYLSTINEIEQC